MRSFANTKTIRNAPQVKLKFHISKILAIYVEMNTIHDYAIVMSDHTTLTCYIPVCECCSGFCLQTLIQLGFSKHLVSSYSL